jgi:4-diphosphocytidyl-2-C-methyl-D-erythritol kinase
VFKINKNSDKINLWCNKKGLPVDSSNLVYKAALLIRKDFKINIGLDIKLYKHIPVGSGLGGASGDAASTLMALNRLYGLKLGKSKLLDYAAKLGADVPFFVLNESFALGKGKGDVFIKAGIKRATFWHILVIPKVKVITKSVYQAFKLSHKKSLTKSLNNVNIIIYALNKKDCLGASKYLHNSLEEVSLEKYPIIRKIKNNLREIGVKAVLMSGSGPAVFGLVGSRKEALRLKRRLGFLNNAEVFVVKTL